MNVMGIQSHFLFEFEAHSNLSFIGQIFVDDQVIRPKEETATSILIDGHGIKLIPDDCLLYSESTASLNPHQRSFLQ